MFSKLLRVVSLLLFVTASCTAQVPASVSGSVSDPAGAVVANAEVTLTMKDTNFKVTTHTNTNGEFSFKNLPSGAYVITVASPGFTQKTVEGVAGVGQLGQVNVVLSVGSITSPVFVESTPLLEPTWNAWLEDPGPAPTFQRLKTVRARSDYEVVLDLAAFQYAPKDKSVAAHPAGSGLLEWLKHQKKDPVHLKILMVPDPAMLTGGGNRVQNLDINLAQLRKYLSGGKHKIPKDPFASLRKNPNSDFRFGHAQFEFHTGSREGLAYVGLSVWASDKPLDEIILPVCISNADDADSCDSPLHSTYHSDPLNAVPLALDKEVPAAALHFFEFDSDRTIGVLHVKEDEYLTWTIDKLTASLGDFINKTLLRNFDKEVADAALEETGYALYNLLLPPQDPDATKARDAIQNLAATRLKLSGSLADAPPIVVRIASRRPDDTFFVPLAMVAVAVDGQKHFLGDLFRVLSPLPFQSYQPEQACISRWVMVMAPDEDQSPKELVQARNQLTPWANACHGADCIDTIPKFESWIGDPTPEKQSTALLILGHYEDESFTFDHKVFVASSAIAKPFQLPSLAILDACGAAAPGADGFIKMLNMAGFQAVVATTTTVIPVMAGQYFNLLAKELENHQGKTDYTISKAHFDAVRALKLTRASSTASPYGAKALIYSLLGNGSLRLCPLPRTPATTAPPKP
jgi:hypothetical protein